MLHLQKLLGTYFRAETSEESVKYSTMIDSMDIVIAYTNTIQDLWISKVRPPQATSYRVHYMSSNIKTSTLLLVEIDRDNFHIFGPANRLNPLIYIWQSLYHNLLLHLSAVSEVTSCSAYFNSITDNFTSKDSKIKLC